MRAVGYYTPQPISNEQALVDLELPTPIARGFDLLVEIKAVSVNPVDTKVRKGQQPENNEARILGYDASGVVKAVGENVTLFKPGDEVYYAGAINRPGTNSEFHLVDERIVGRKPSTLSFAQAAALPLTSITVYEALFHRLKLNEPVAGALPAVLITGGAGGVGSIAIQLVKQLSDLEVIATASRPETTEWAKALGADYVIDHSKPLAGEYTKLGIKAPAFIFSVTHSVEHQQDLAEIIAPQGRLALIDDFGDDFHVINFKRKSISLHWEMMFTRPLLQTSDMIEQHRLLNHVAALVDAGKIRTTLSETLGTMTAANLKAAHALVEGGKMRGKAVLQGFAA
ncbi:zinc-binding alcohol dehydrogenase family protein [Rhizobium sp.]|jgi:NADPH:quinone reductase|uniref:zinc-binding alcohol dehydrogenase family protein n=1 Tax=Rhizobium sp. TaxID=391 RepID=UPI000E8EE947|nr:zinc-binding alcohol dehydrogenase family protein [Rhizobium sp.]